MARQLKAQDEVELSIEKMQPSWLESSRSRWQYRLSVGLIFGLILGLITRSTVGSTSGLIPGLIFGLILGSELHNIEPVESFRISISNQTVRAIMQSLQEGLVLGLLFALGSGLIFGLSFGLDVGPNAALIFGLTSGLNAGLIFGLIKKLKQDLQIRTKPNQGIWNSSQISILTTILCYPAGVVLVMLSPLSHLILEKQDWTDSMGIFWKDAPSFLLPGVFGALLFSFLEGGGVTCIQHLILRIILTRDRIIPWNFARFLNYCTERRLLQRIGGRYRFLHRELLDHFAEMRG